jgi:PKHD-type hydroxylase
MSLGKTHLFILSDIIKVMSQFDTDPTKFIKYNSNLNNYFFFRTGLSDDDMHRFNEQLLSELKSKSDSANNDNATTDNLDSLEEGNVSGVVDKTYRNSRIHWIPKSDEWKWLYDKIGGFAFVANEEMWQFDITFMNEQVQYTEYDGSYSGKYDWHLDIGSGPSSMRKIAIIVQLSDPNDYEGGDLQFFIQKNVLTAPKDKGAVICFPTYFLHRVTPVTKGKRRSLVLWVSGPPFR